jgi:hypothetical protein
LHFTSRKSCKRSIGGTKKHSSWSTSWQTSEVNFTIFVKIPGSESAWIRTATPLPSSWRGSFWTEGRLVLSTRASATRAVPVLRVFGRPLSIMFGKGPEFLSHSLMHSLRRISECAASPAKLISRRHEETDVALVVNGSAQRRRLESRTISRGRIRMRSGRNGVLASIERSSTSAAVSPMMELL